jgi:hypothetical protein
MGNHPVFVFYELEGSRITLSVKSNFQEGCQAKIVDTPSNI